jgi:hypothetical protein
MACDCEIHRYIADPVGHIVDLGRKRRIVSDVQFDLLMIRDHGCRWPGCGVPAVQYRAPRGRLFHLAYARWTATRFACALDRRLSAGPAARLTRPSQA